MVNKETYFGKDLWSPYLIHDRIYIASIKAGPCLQY